MKRFLSFLFPSFLVLVVIGTPAARAALITAVPGPDDQGGMLMPMVTIQATAGTGTDPTAGMINVAFSPASVPVLNSLQTWSPGDWFAADAAWRQDIGSPEGVGGTPPENAGNGDLFNNQYGFTAMRNGTTMMANVPTGKSLAIKLTALSSNAIESFNYSSSANRWDSVFTSVGSQVLWNGSMWHNYFTLPASAAAGTYTATFEVFIATTACSGTTGFAQYDTAALNATADGNFTPASVTYTWNVSAVPEPSAFALAGLGGLAGIAGMLIRRKSSSRAGTR